MNSVRSAKSPFFTRLATGLAMVAATCAVIITAPTADKSTQADAPWDCNRDGTVCSPF